MAKTNWQGRIDNPVTPLTLRYHQIVKEIEHTALSQSEKTVAFVGFECEAGVARNQGRIGAKDAPQALRQALSSISWHGSEKSMLYDTGNITCHNDELEEAQQALGKRVKDILEKKIPVVILGGGHETTYGHYLGVRQAYPEAKIGIINIDAHFDMRPYEKQTSSGTMFRQILDEDSNASYFVVGIQRYGNTRDLFEQANKYGVNYILEDEMLGHLEQVQARLAEFIEAHEVVYVTLCTDVLNAAEAPGVSAPSPFGLSAIQVRHLLRFITAFEKVVSFDICEVNPALDLDLRTVKLGAHLINEVVLQFTDL
ncbi:formimidoylglutamase [Lysinibacillus sp. LZ02]|uniref:formimidoylglutamase n=1 Tax=Lysinibacillus sp. LZ02 TaxID=3420668 RepID=UPI003D36674C